MGACLRRIPGILVALVLANQDATSQIVQRHPDRRYVQVAVAPRFSTGLTDEPAFLPFRLGVTPVAAFGSELDSEDVLIGNVLDAVITPQREIAVLDDKLFRLRVFDPQGRPTQSLGREGQGPGEFARAVLSLTADRSGNLLVADLARSVKVFSKGPNGYAYAEAISLSVSAQSMCMLGPLLVVNASTAAGPQLLHTFQRDGTRVSAFGSFYRSPNTSLNYQYNTGFVACDEDRNLIYFAPRGGFGEVHAYRPDGTLVWRTTIEGFRSNTVEDKESGGTRVQVAPGGVHTVFTLTLLPGFGLLLQVRHRTPTDLEQKAWFSTLTSFLLDPTSGRPTPLGTAVPPITAATAQHCVVVAEDPVPRFELRTISQP